MKCVFNYNPEYIQDCIYNHGIAETPSMVHRTSKLNYFTYHEILNVNKLYEEYGFSMVSQFYHVFRNWEELSVQEAEDDPRLTLYLSNGYTIAEKGDILYRYTSGHTPFNYHILNLFRHMEDGHKVVKQIIGDIVAFFKHNLLAVQKLQEQSILHNCINIESILITADANALLSEFSLSIDTSKDILHHARYVFAEYNPSHIEWPIEIHLLCFMNQYNVAALSDEQIECIVNECIDTNVCYQRTTPDEITNLKTGAMEHFYKYINWEFDDIVIDMMDADINTWDTYSLGITYIRILDHLEQYSTNKKFTEYFLRILRKMISAIPSERYSQIAVILQEYTHMILIDVSPSDYEELVDDIWNTFTGDVGEDEE